MSPSCTAAVFTLLLAFSPLSSAQTTDSLLGRHHAWLDSPGGELPFGLTLGRAPNGGLQALIHNGAERIPVPEVHFDGREHRIRLAFPHYDSVLEGRVHLRDGVVHIIGTWTKTSGPEKRSRLPFHSVLTDRPRFDLEGHDPAIDRLPPRFRVRFAKASSNAVGLFEVDTEGTARGTFLTTTGDYRYLAGTYAGARLRLSVFDGAHAFLFDARRQEDGRLRGTFWSRDSWKEGFVATPDSKIKLPSALQQVRWVEGKTLADIETTLDGRKVRLNDPRFHAPVRIVEIFGSWCPNCHDHARLMRSLHEEYGPKGLGIVGLAFELTGKPERDQRQVDRFAALHRITYPLMLTGIADKQQATRQLGVLDQMRSYPTTIFLDSRGTPRAIWSGFSGPATGDAGKHLEKEFRSIIERLLEEQRQG